MSQFHIAVAATSSPVTLARAKEHLFIYDTTEDDYIQALILAAQQIVCDYMGEFVSATEIIYDVKDWSPAELPHQFVDSIASIQYRNSSNALTTVSSSDYTFENSSFGPRIIFGDNARRNTLSSEYQYPIRITYDAVMPAIPASVTQAILIVLGEIYQARSETAVGNVVNKFPITAERLIRSYRRR